MGQIIAVLDTESTGVYANDKAIQVGALYFDAGPKEWNYIGFTNIYNKVDKAISAPSRQIHGISDDMLNELSAGKYYSDYVDELSSLFEYVDVFLGHNVPFDIRMVKNTYGDIIPREVQLINTISTSSQHFGTRLKLPQFAKMALHANGMTDNTFDKAFKEEFGEGGYHGALYDAYVTARTYMLLENKRWIYPDI